MLFSFQQGYLYIRYLAVRSQALRRPQRYVLSQPPLYLENMYCDELLYHTITIFTRSEDYFYI